MELHQAARIPVPKSWFLTDLRCDDWMLPSPKAFIVSYSSWRSIQQIHQEGECRCHLKSSTAFASSPPVHPFPFIFHQGHYIVDSFFIKAYFGSLCTPVWHIGSVQSSGSLSFVEGGGLLLVYGHTSSSQLIHKAPQERAVDLVWMEATWVTRFHWNPHEDEEWS